MQVLATIALAVAPKVLAFLLAKLQPGVDLIDGHLEWPHNATTTSRAFKIASVAYLSCMKV